MTTTKNKLDNLFAALGNTSDNVAANLLAAGCFGKRGKLSCCPIARFAKDNGADKACWVDARVAHSIDPVDYDAYASLPATVRIFISRFDEGGFPALEI